MKSPNAENFIDWLMAVAFVLIGQLAAFHLIAIIDGYQFKCLSLVVHFFMALTTIGAAVVYLNKIEMSEEPQEKRRKD